MVDYAAPVERSAPLSARWLVVGFISGFVSVLIFHQGALELLHLLGLTAGTAYSTKATAPFGIPTVWSLAFWGGVWGVVLAALFARLRTSALIGWSIVFGAIVPTLVAWLVVAPMKHQPVAAGFVPAAMLVGPIVNAAWGLGTGLGVALFRQRTPRASAAG